MAPLPRRLFIGLIPERATQLAIQRHCRDWQWPEGHVPTRFGRYHLTLHFLGYIGAGIEVRLRRLLREITMPPVQLQLAHAQMWRNGIAVLQPGDDADVRALHAVLLQAVAAAGLPARDPIEPHVTLARHATHGQPPVQFPPIPWPVREFALVWSRLYPEVMPSRYEILERFPLTGADRPTAACTRGAGGQLHLFGP